MRSIVIAVALFLMAPAFADDKAPPSQLADVDRLRLENALLKLGNLQQQADRLIAERNAIYARYQVAPADVGKTVAINLETGAIARAPKSKAEPAKK
jgi:hypothetical protein